MLISPHCKEWNKAITASQNWILEIAPHFVVVEVFAAVAAPIKRMSICCEICTVLNVIVCITYTIFLQQVFSCCTNYRSNAFALKHLRIRNYVK